MEFTDLEKLFYEKGYWLIKENNKIKIQSIETGNFLKDVTLEEMDERLDIILKNLQ